MCGGSVVRIYALEVGLSWLEWARDRLEPGLLVVGRESSDCDTVRAREEEVPGREWSRLTLRQDSGRCSAARLFWLGLRQWVNIVIIHCACGPPGGQRGIEVVQEG